LQALLDSSYFPVAAEEINLLIEFLLQIDFQEVRRSPLRKQHHQKLCGSCP
jgi:hypothetical protein